MSLWERVKALVARPRIVVEGGVVHKQALWEQHSRIGGGLSPATVSAIFRQADVGDIARLVELSNESRAKDGTLHKVLRGRETALSAYPYTIEPYTEGHAEPSARDVEVADFVRYCKDNANGDGDEVKSFDDLIVHLQGGIYHGHAVSEAAWTKAARHIVPVGYVPIDQRRFSFRSSDGRLVWSDSYLGLSRLGNGGVDLFREFPGQFIQHQPRELGDVPSREGLCRLLVWAALFRNWAIGDWLKLAELAWKPWRLGVLKKDAGEKSRDNIINMLEQLTSSGVGVYAEDQAELDIRWPEGSASGGAGKSAHQALCDWLGDEMSRAVSGGTLTTSSGDRGARSLGEVHERSERRIAEHDARRVNSTLRAHHWRPLVTLNFGPAVPLPKTGFATDDAVDLFEFGRGVKVLKESGLKIGSAYVYDVAGIPRPAEDEELLGDGVEEDVDVSGLDGEGDDEQTSAPDEGEDEAPEADGAEE